MKRERGQSLVEVVAAVPVCLACALAIADCGVIVRDRIAVSQAAGRAATASVEGSDVERAAKAALPGSMHGSMVVTQREGRIAVRAASGSRIAKLAGRDVIHRSSVEVAR